MKDNIESLLVIEPHPDDMILMCGGFVKRLTNDGVKVYIVTFTYGGATSFYAKEMKAARQAESRKADLILGINPINREILDYETRSSWDNHSKLYSDLLKWIKRIGPNTIITMHYDKKHPDHMWIGQFIEPLAYQASEGIRTDWGDPVRPTILLGENSRSRLESPNSYCDITNTLQFKLDALRTQETQIPILGKDIFDRVEKLASDRAKERGPTLKYAEAFQKLEIDY